jgi:Tol biopolymer transport system component
MLAAFCILSKTLLAQTTLQTALYLNQGPAGLTPTVFAPGQISQKDLYEYGSVFSGDGKEFYYAVIISGKPQIRYSRFDNQAWAAPKTVIGSADYEYNDPFLSPDGKRLFFISDQPLTGKGNKKDFDIWYLEREKDGWSQVPVNAGPAINTDKNEYYMSFAKNGTLYFSSNGGTGPGTDKNYDIRSSPFSKGVFKPSARLDSAVNTVHYEADVFVSPDEQYLIFCSERPGGLGQGDLYISFKNKSGTWQKAKNMGSTVNTSGYEFCPYITNDGKYLFFSRDGDIFWLKTDLIETLR